MAHRRTGCSDWLDHVLYPPQGQNQPHRKHHWTRGLSVTVRKGKLLGARESLGVFGSPVFPELKEI
jgi:hypothetical protein